MKDRLNAYVEGLFADAERRNPNSGRLAELKEELLQNTYEKYDHLLAMGKSPETAYRMAVEGIGDMTELLNALAGENAPAEPPVSHPSAQQNADAPSHPSEPSVICADGIGDAENGSHDGDDDGEKTERDEEQDEEASGRPPRSRWYSLVSGIIWKVTLCAYFVLSFSTHAWSVTWLLFMMGIAADNVAKCIFDLRR